MCSIRGNLLSQKTDMAVAALCPISDGSGPVRDRWPRIPPRLFASDTILRGFGLFSVSQRRVFSVRGRGVEHSDGSHCKNYVLLCMVVFGGVNVMSSIGGRTPLDKAAGCAMETLARASVRFATTCMVLPSVPCGLGEIAGSGVLLKATREGRITDNRWCCPLFVRISIMGRSGHFVGLASTDLALGFRGGTCFQ